MSKFCPMTEALSWECQEEKCAWWVPDLNFRNDPPTDEGWCAVREIASKLGWLRSLDREQY